MSAPSADRHIRRLPKSVVPDLVARHRLLLLFDYDGTLAEIVPEPDQARPLPGVARQLAELANYRDRVTIAIVTGRTIEQLEKMLPLPSAILIAGVHGLELKEGARRRILLDRQRYQAATDKVRQWLSANIAGLAGFIVEDKRIAVALHYRNAAPPAAIIMRRRFHDFVIRNAPELRLLYGKKVTEALPWEANKGSAVSEILRRAGRSRLPVYFGDDRTDEDAFAVVRERGVAVRIGSHLTTKANYRIDKPSDIVPILAQLLSTLKTLRPPSKVTRRLAS